MARAVITDKNVIKTRLVEEKGPKLKSLVNVGRTVLINEVLPFRVRFTTIGINAYGPNNVPPIGIAIVGLNNYIL